MRFISREREVFLVGFSLTFPRFPRILKNRRNTSLWKSRSSRSQIFFKIGVPKNVANFTGKHLCWSLFLIKLKTESNTGVFRWNFVIWTEHLRRLLLDGVCEGTGLGKILLFRHFYIFGINHRCFRKMPVKKIMNNCDCWNVYRFSCSSSFVNSSLHLVKSYVVMLFIYVKVATVK